MDYISSVVIFLIKMILREVWTLIKSLTFVLQNVVEGRGLSFVGPTRRGNNPWAFGYVVLLKEL